MYAALQKYMMNTGADILSVFEIMDKDRSNNLTEDELYTGLERLRIADISRDDARCLMDVLDIN